MTRNAKVISLAVSFESGAEPVTVRMHRHGERIRAEVHVPYDGEIARYISSGPAKLSTGHARTILDRALSDGKVPGRMCGSVEG